jgi:hypothetical protein
VFAQILSAPVIVPGILGALPALIVFVLATDVPPHPVAVTETIPEPDPGVTKIELPLAMPVQPVGNDHV